MAAYNPFRNLQADALIGDELNPPAQRRDPRAVQQEMRTKIQNMRQQLQTLLQMEKIPNANRVRKQIEGIEQGLMNLEYKHDLEPINTKCENFDDIRAAINESLREEALMPRASFEGLEFASSAQLRIIENDLLKYFNEEFARNEVPPTGMKLSCR